MGSAGSIIGLFLQLWSPRVHGQAGVPLILGHIVDKYMQEAEHKSYAKNRERSIDRGVLRE